VSERHSHATADTLAAVHGTITTAIGGLGEAELMLPTRCAGWVIGDLLYHLLLDARRALRTFASPAAGPADVDDVTYWRAYSRSAEQDAIGSAEAAAHARHVRIVAAAYPPGALAWEWGETSGAACRAARSCPHELVTTQGHVLTTADFVATLAVEAAVHYLDLTVNLPSAPAPDPAALLLVRQVLDGLLGAPAPAGWDDGGYVLKGTGRVPLSGDDRAELGALADRFPLFG
jgi:hypothetical protein